MLHNILLCLVCAGTNRQMSGAAIHVLEVMIVVSKQEAAEAKLGTSFVHLMKMATQAFEVVLCIPAGAASQLRK